MAVDPGAFRSVLAQWPSGVTVVTTLAEDGADKGMTATSFSSVSADPPLVSVCLDKKLYTHQLIRDSGVFGVNLLAKDQIEVARTFAGMVPDVTDRFAGDSWERAETGVNLLEHAQGWVDCRLVHAYEGGTHTIFVGEVLAAKASSRTSPLVFHSRGWGQFADSLPEVATLADTAVIANIVAAGRDEEIASSVATLSEAGVRVRVAQADAATSLGDWQATLAAVPWPAQRSLTSVLVASREQAEAALAHEVGAIEVEADVTDPAWLDAAARIIDGIGERAVVHLRNPFVAPTESVLAALEQLKAHQPREISLPDGGEASVLAVRDLLQVAVPLARPIALRLGLHERDRLGLVKALTAMKSGVRDFDATLAGVGAALATEDMIRLFSTLEVDASLDTSSLGDLAARLRGEQTSVLSANTPSAERDIVGAAG